VAFRKEEIISKYKNKHSSFFIETEEIYGGILQLKNTSIFPITENCTIRNIYSEYGILSIIRYWKKKTKLDLKFLLGHIFQTVTKKE
jgi:hypothetical protein